MINLCQRKYTNRQNSIALNKSHTKILKSHQSCYDKYLHNMKQIFFIGLLKLVLSDSNTRNFEKLEHLAKEIENEQDKVDQCRIEVNKVKNDMKEETEKFKAKLEKIDKQVARAQASEPIVKVYVFLPRMYFGSIFTNNHFRS